MEVEDPIDVEVIIPEKYLSPFIIVVESDDEDNTKRKYYKVKRKFTKDTESFQAKE